jgi:hypothetical protein
MSSQDGWVALCALAEAVFADDLPVAFLVEVPAISEGRTMGGERSGWG